ncbi:hypothetical protein DB763_22750, partial [Xanthomonas perforans]
MGGKTYSSPVCVASRFSISCEPARPAKSSHAIDLRADVPQDHSGSLIMAHAITLQSPLGKTL